MSKTIKLCGNNLIEIASYRNPEAVFHIRELKAKEKYCVYDEHLQGYCMGLSTGGVKTLVKKIGGIFNE